MTTIRVGLGTCGIAAGAEDTFAALEARVGRYPFRLEKTGCLGMCYREPLVLVTGESGASWQYGPVTPKEVDRLLEEHVAKGQVVTDLLVSSSEGGGSEQGYFARQTRIVLRNSGAISPESIEEYLQPCAACSRRTIRMRSSARSSTPGFAAAGAPASSRG
jgi:NADH-quinone oxidoreductase subunit F